MKLLIQILEKTEDGREYIVTFSSRDVFGLKDFEMVDETIYNRSDLCVADVVSQIKCDKKFYKIGTGIEFSIKDIIKVIGPVDGAPKSDRVIYKKGQT